MKICITSTGKDLESTIDPRFGRCAFFLFLTEDGEVEEAIENPGVNFSHGAGVNAAQTVISKNAKVVITGNMGPRAYSLLDQAGVKIFLAPLGISAKEAFLKWKNNELPLLSELIQKRGFGRGPRGRRGPRRWFL